MRSVWSQVARPKARVDRPITTTSHTHVAQTIRRSTSAPIRGRLTFSNAFTFLLTPILGTALIADTSWKNKKRKEWAEKISEVEAETERLHAEGVKRWQKIQFRSVQLGAAYQRRQYSTAVHLYDVQEDPEDSLESPEWEETAHEMESDSSVSSQADPTDQPEEEPMITDDDLVALGQLKRLLGLRLALKLTLYMNTGSTPRFLDKNPANLGPFNNVESPGVFDIDGHIQKLKIIGSSIRSLEATIPCQARFSADVLLEQEPMTESSTQLQNAVLDIAAGYKSGSMSRRSFISSFSQILIDSSASISTSSYVAMLDALSAGRVVGNHDLAMQILHAFHQSRLSLTDCAIFHILKEVGHQKGVHHFDWFMKELTRKAPKINIRSSWTWEESEGVQVPVPVNKNPKLLQILVLCGLRFDQPHKAEAWASLFQKHWQGNPDKLRGQTNQILTNFLRYYAVTRNWRKGVMWLDAANEWTPDLSQGNNIRALQRIVLSMLNLCVACGKGEMYTQLLKVAADSRIGPLDASHLKSGSWRRAIISEWRQEQINSAASAMEYRSDGERAREFQRQARFILKGPAQDPPKVPFVLETRSLQNGQPVETTLVAPPTELSAALNKANSWRQLYREQKIEIERLKLKLERSDRQRLSAEKLKLTKPARERNRRIEQLPDLHAVDGRWRRTDPAKDKLEKGPQALDVLMTRLVRPEQHFTEEATTPRLLAIPLEMIQILIKQSGENLCSLTDNTERTSNDIKSSIGAKGVKIWNFDIKGLASKVELMASSIEETAQELQIFTNSLPRNWPLAPMPIRSVLSKARPACQFQSDHIMGGYAARDQFKLQADGDMLAR